MLLDTTKNCQQCRNYRAGIKALTALPDMPNRAVFTLVDEAHKMFNEHKADHRTELLSLVADVEADLRRNSADDAQQSFGDLLRHLGLDD